MSQSKKFIVAKDYNMLNTSIKSVYSQQKQQQDQDASKASQKSKAKPPPKRPRFQTQESSINFASLGGIDDVINV